MSVPLAGKLESRIVKIVLPLVFIFTISYGSAWSEVTGNSWLTPVLVITYITLFFGVMIGIGVKNFRKRMREVRQYLSSIKSGAVEKLTKDDIVKVLEKDAEYVRETSTYTKKQLKNMGIMLIIFIVIAVSYSTFLSHHLDVLSKSLGTNLGLSVFWLKFVKYLIYFAILLAFLIIIPRIFGFHLFPKTESLGIPYIPLKEIVFYKDAIILDNMYLLKAPLKVKQVIVNEKRRFIELEFSEVQALPSTKLRIYVKSPRDFWENLLSRYVKIVK